MGAQRPATANSFLDQWLAKKNMSTTHQNTSLGKNRYQNTATNPNSINKPATEGTLQTGVGGAQAQPNAVSPNQSSINHATINQDGHIEVDLKKPHTAQNDTIFIDQEGNFYNRGQ